MFLATAASYISDGPTLPIIGGVDEHASPIKPSKVTNDARPLKKRKTDKHTSTEPTEHAVAAKKLQIDLEPLYKVWTLLPRDLLQQTEKRLGGRLEEKVKVVVFTKNQNVKSGINRLKTLLGFEETQSPSKLSEDDSKARGNDSLVAISAYGEGTTKMVGIVEMTKRAVSGGNGKEVKNGETWYAYTSLIGLDLQMRQENGTERGGELEKEDNPTTDKGPKNKIPILTVWFSRKHLPEFKATFGEQTFTVLRHSSDA